MSVPHQIWGEGRPMEILRIEEVVKMVGLSRTSIWRRIKDDDFPAPRRLGGPNTRAVGWLRADIEDWLASRRPAGDEAPPHNDGPKTRSSAWCCLVLQGKEAFRATPERWAIATRSRDHRRGISSDGQTGWGSSFRQLSFRLQRNGSYRQRPLGPITRLRWN